MINIDNNYILLEFFFSIYYVTQIIKSSIIKEFIFMLLKYLSSFVINAIVFINLSAIRLINLSLYSNINLLTPFFHNATSLSSILSSIYISNLLIYALF